MKLKNKLKNKKNKFLIFLCVLACLLFVDVNASLAAPKAKKNAPAQIKSIVKLFTEINPALKSADAKNYAEYILEAGEKFKQEPFAIAALIVHESTVRNNAVSKGGDYGLMQVRWRVHKNNITKKYPAVKQAKDMFKPRENILIGTEIFANYRGDADLKTGIRRYSAGSEKLVNKVSATMSKLDNYYKNFLN